MTEVKPASMAALMYSKSLLWSMCRATGTLTFLASEMTMGAKAAGVVQLLSMQWPG